MKLLKKLLALFTVNAVMAAALPVNAYALEQPSRTLQFRDGSFKILILSDIQDTNTPQKETLDLMNAAITETQPDLIVLNGDNIAGWWNGVNKEQTRQAVDIIASAIDSRQIPFALVFGNHDHEGLAGGKNGMTEEEAKEFILSCFQNYGTCLAVEGEEMTGVGTYNLPIKDSGGEKTVFNLWFMDSNPYAPEEEGGGYGYVHEDQTQWYCRTSDALRAENSGVPVPSLLFQHIAVPEVYEMFTESGKKTKGAVRGHGSWSKNYYSVNPDYIYEGSLNEGPCPPDVNHGQFESWLRQGDIIGAFFGHDHVNDYAGEYKGIKLVAAPAVGYFSYGNHHGVRTITLNENDLSSFESQILLSDEILGYKVKNIYKANHGYYEYKKIFLPALFGGIGVIAAVSAAATLTVKAARKRKGK